MNEAFRALWMDAVAAEDRLDHAAAADLYADAAEQATALAPAIDARVSEARCHAAIGRYDRALALVSDANDRAQVAGDGVAEVTACAGVAVVRAARREWAEALAAFRTLRDLARDRGGVDEAACTLGECEAHLALNAPADAADHLEALAILTSDGATANRCRAIAVLSALQAFRGDLEATDLGMRDALEPLQAERWTLLRGWIGGVLGRALAAAGQPELAGGALQVAAQAWRRLGNAREVAHTGLEAAGALRAANQLIRADAVLGEVVEAVSGLGDPHAVAMTYVGWADVAVALHSPRLAVERLAVAAPVVRAADGPEAVLFLYERLLYAMGLRDEEAAADLAKAIELLWPERQRDAWGQDRIMELTEQLTAVGARRVAFAILTDSARAALQGGQPADSARLWADAGFVALKAEQHADAAKAFDNALALAGPLELDELDWWREARDRI